MCESWKSCANGAHSSLIRPIRCNRGPRAFMPSVNKSCQKCETESTPTAQQPSLMASRDAERRSRNDRERLSSSGTPSALKMSKTKSTPFSDASQATGAFL